MDAIVGDKGSDFVLVSANVSSYLFSSFENDEGWNVLELVAVPGFANLVEVAINEHHGPAVCFLGKFLEEGCNVSASAAAFSAQFDKDGLLIIGVKEIGVLGL